MPDYYSLLERKIKETESDPARIRQIVYEAARLALKRQVHLLQPPMAIPETKRQLRDLEEAIARFEADTAIRDDPHEFTEPEQDETGLIRASSRRDRPAVADPEGDEAPVFQPNKNDRHRPADREEVEAIAVDAPDDRHAFADEDEAQPAPANAANNRRSFRDSVLDEAPAARAARRNRRGALADLEEDQSAVERLEEEDWKEPTDRPRNRPKDRLGDRPRHRPASRELVLVPDRSIEARRPSTVLVRPDDFATSADIIYGAPPERPGSFGRRLLSGFGMVFQLAIATLAAVAFYVAVWQRNATLQPAQDTPAATVSAQPKAPPGAGETASPATPPGETAAAAAIPVSAAPAFPHPTAYGIYAISDNRLIELEQVATAPVDPRTRNLLQIVKPGRIVIDDGRLAFIAFRRDLMSSAPEKVPVRIAARIARSMNFDTSGKSVVTAPVNETWLIRDQGYDLRVSPVRESPEMIMLRPENAEFAFPAGRYELLLGGQAYDFVIAGAVTDPAQCVEGVATVRGPIFYQCKSQ